LRPLVYPGPPTVRALVTPFLPTPPRPPRSTLFPYTTLFRSMVCSKSQRCPVEKRRMSEQEDSQVQQAAQQAVLLFTHASFLHGRSEEHTSELQSRFDLVCRLLLAKQKPRRGSPTRATQSPST